MARGLHQRRQRQFYEEGGFLLELRSCLDQVHYWFELPLSISICTGNEDSALKMEGVESIKKILIEKGGQVVC